MAFIAFAPAVFVLIWSTGWIVAKYAAPHADPLTFLTLRYALAGIAVAGCALALRSSWPKTPRAWFRVGVGGILLHALYLGGVWWAIAQGLPAGISALIAALQPLLTAALAAPLAGERLTWGQRFGIGLGFVGVLGVLAPKLVELPAAALTMFAGVLAVNAFAMLSVTLGTFYQKRFIAAGDLVSTTAIQYAAAFAVTLPAAALLEPMRIDWTREAIGAMAWSVFVLSMGAIGLMLLLIRRGAVSKVAALIYLVPPTAALQAYAMFGETLSGLQILAMFVTAYGVFLSTRAR